MAKRGARNRKARPPVSYEQFDREEPGVGNPIDLAVHRRVGRGPLLRQLARTSQAVVDALGRRRRVWFAYEDVLSRLTDLRQAAYFDLGVQHGVAATRATAMVGGRKRVNALAQRVARELMRTEVARSEVVGAALVAAWSLLGGRTARRPAR